MQELIEEKFPFLDENGVAKTYKNVIDLVNHQSVRRFFLKKILNRKHLLSSLVLSQCGKVALYHHIVSTPENIIVTIKDKTSYKLLPQI